MKITDFEYDTGTGFAWATLDDGNTIQCCLVTKEQPEDSLNDPVFLPEIIAYNSGCDDGICGDVNAPAFKRWGQNRCMTAFFQHAERNGLAVQY